MATEVLIERPRKIKKNKPIIQSKETTLDSSSHDLTRNKFNEILQQAYLQSTQNESKSGKKKKKKSDLDVEMSNMVSLESLRKGEGLRKDQDDSVLLANTYDPDDIKSRKSNKARNNKNYAGTNNPAYDANENDSPKKTKGRALPQRSPDISMVDKEMSISELSTSPVKKKDEPPPQAPERKKKKKKILKTTTSDTEQVLSEVPETTEEQNLSPAPQEEPDPEATQAAKKKKKKKKKQGEEDTVHQVEAYEAALEEEGAQASPRVVQDDGHIAGLTIHRTDKLKTDFFIAHPLVRVSMVDQLTGKYVKKQTKGRAVTSFYEKENENVDMVLPIMTQPYDFKEHKSTLPVWEEMVIFNENFNYLTQEDPKVMIFFEVLDFVSMNTARVKYNNAKQEGGWHRIAWAFLKVVGANGKPNTDKKVRLQLYQPPLRFRSRGEQLEIFQWWKTGQRLPYPSTLYVTVKRILPPDMVEPAARSMFATQQERGRITYDELQKTLEGDGTRREGVSKKGPSLWERLPGQVCKIPNTAVLSLPAGRKGCFVLRFSHDGKSLACGCADKEGHPILIYEIPSGKLKGQLLGHYSIIYDLCWVRNDKQLLSASADGTARIWDVVKFSTTPQKMLPHPSFVYSAQFHPRVSKIVVTGSYDRMIRVWSLQGDDPHALLVQELGGHTSYVNTLCFDEEGSKLYSGDSLGQISVWNVYVTDKPSSRGVTQEWSHNRNIDEPEIRGIAINCLQLHPNNRRLLVHCRDNSIRMIDLRINSIMQRYIGALNFRERIRSYISPCGTFVFAGSEDSCVYVWNTETGDQVAMYSELSYKSPVCDVHFHPYDHVVAICSYGESQPVLVYKYDHKVAQHDLGLDLVEPLSPTTMRRTGRPQSPELRPGLQVDKSDDEGLETGRSRVMSLCGDHHSQETARLERVRRKLDSVAAFQSTGIERSYSPTLPGVPSNNLQTTADTWGSTFDTSLLYSQVPRLSPEPGTFSPHASKNMGMALQQQQFAAHTEYMKGGSGWRPAFSAIGGKPGPRSLSPVARAAHMAISMMGRKSRRQKWQDTGTITHPGKAQFSFQGPSSRIASINREMLDVPGTPTSRPLAGAVDSSSSIASLNVDPSKGVFNLIRQRKRGNLNLKVVALYDYQAQRSDELCLVRGDIITVLYKDNDNWWMGELPDGSQGFFPANYVAGRSTDKSFGGSSHAKDEDKQGENDLKIHIDPPEEEEEEKSTITTAVITKSGDLKFVSGTEDSDTDTPKQRTKRRGRRSQDTRIQIDSDEGTPIKGTRKKRPIKTPSRSESTA